MIKASTAEMHEVERQIEHYIAEKEDAQTKITGLRAELARIKRRGAANGWVTHRASDAVEPAKTTKAKIEAPIPAFLQAASSELAYKPAPKRPLTEWTVDEIIAENLKRAGQGLPEMWGTAEALEHLAKQPPAD